MTRSRNRDQRGLVSVIVAISALALIVVAALVIDGGSARLTRRASQNAADAASLAGVNRLYPTSRECTNRSSESVPPCFQDAVKAVTDYTSYNFSTSAAQWVSCADPDKDVGSYTVPGASACISFYSKTAPFTSADGKAAPYRLRVRVPVRNVPTGLGSITGKSAVVVSAKAEAVVDKGTKCALCILGDLSTNNSDFTVDGGSMAVGGSITANSNAAFTADSISVLGTASGGTYSPAWDRVSEVPDPFASLSLPVDTSSSAAFPARTNPCATVANGGGQGIYGAIDLPNSTCTMQPGIYVITGAWGAKNNTLLTSTGGVTLYLRSTGSIDFKNGEVNLTAPTSGVTAGFVLLADRNATAPITLQGNGGTGLTGKIYTKSAKLEFNGNSCFGIQGGPVVVGGSSSVGNKSCVKVTDAQDVTLNLAPPALSR